MNDDSLSCARALCLSLFPPLQSTTLPSLVIRTEAPNILTRCTHSFTHTMLALFPISRKFQPRPSLHPNSARSHLFTLLSPVLIYLPVVLSNPSFASSIGHSLSSPFHLHLLSRRQAGTTPSLGAIDGLTTLLTQALQGQQTGECAEECQSWTEAVQVRVRS